MKVLRQILGNRSISGFAKKSLSAVVIKIGAAGLSFVMFVALARAMTQEDFGLFGFAFSLATILCVFGSFGQRNLVLRFASVYIDQDDAASAFAVIRGGYLLVLLGSGGLGLCLIIGSFWVPAMIEHRPLFVATGFLTLMLALAEFQPHPQRAAGRVWLALLPRDILLRVVMIMFAVAVTAGVVTQVSAYQMVYTMAFSLAVLVTLQAFLLSYTNPLRLLRARVDLSNRQQWRKAMWGMWGNSVVMSSGRNVAVVLLGALLPAATTGAVFAALRTSMVLELFLVAVNVVAAPLLASKLHRGEFAKVQGVCTKIAIMLGFPTLIVFVVFILWGGWVLDLFGDGYAVAHGELVVMSLGYLVSAFCGPTTQIMEMSGYERQYFLMLVVTTALSLGALPVAVMFFGSMGAAWCIAFNLIALNLSAYVFIVKKIGVSPGIIRLGKVPET